MFLLLSFDSIVIFGGLIAGIVDEANKFNNEDINVKSKYTKILK